MPLLMGIDIGTSACKVTLFDEMATALSSHTCEYRLHYPNAGWVEHNAMDWWTASIEGIHSVLKGHDPSDIAAIGVDGTSWACLPVDKQGVPLSNAMIWLDRRAREEAEFVAEVLGDDLLKSGNPADAAYITPKVLWLKKHMPEIYNDADCFLQCNAFIVRMLTGCNSQDYSQGYGLHFFDMATLRWNEGFADRLGIDLAKFASPVPCHSVVGVVTEHAAAITGLKSGTPVVAGGLDAACCTFGAGVINPTQTQEQGGQAGGMSICLCGPKAHPKLILGAHVVPDRWLLQGGTTGGAGTIRWLKQQMNFDSYEQISQMAAQSPAGANGLIFMPYMAGERSPIWDADARGVFFGLSFDKTRADICRSVMEGVAYSLKHNLNTAKEVGAEAGVLRSVGGAANSDVWTQIKADVTGHPFEVPASDNATAWGAAMLAGVGVGVFQSFDEAASTVSTKKSYTPDNSNYAIYDEYYNLYLELYESLSPKFKSLAAIAGR